MMEYLWVILSVFLSISEVYLCYHFVFLCGDGWEQIRSWKKGAVIGITILLGMLMGINRTLFFYSYTMFAIQTLVVALSLLFLLKTNKGIGILTEISFFALVGILDFTLAFPIQISLEEDFQTYIFYRVSVYKIVIYLVVRAVTFVVILNLHKKKMDAGMVIVEYQKGIMVFSIISIVVLCIYQCIFTEFMEEGTVRNVIGMSFSLFVIVFLLFLGSWLLLKNAEMEKEQNLIAIKDEMLESQYQEVRERIEEGREVAHDMKHHLRVLQGYVEAGELEQVKNYLAEMNLSVSRAEPLKRTSSLIINLILKQKEEEAVEKKIRMHLQVDSTFLLPLQEHEICALLGNLLDNAIEACEKVEEEKRWIEVEFSKKNQMVFIQIVNPYEQELVRTGDTFATTKSDPRIHGTGLKSVRRIVERYHGDLQFDIEEDEFTVCTTFLIANKENEEDENELRTKEGSRGRRIDGRNERN